MDIKQYYELISAGPTLTNEEIATIAINMQRGLTLVRLEIIEGKIQATLEVPKVELLQKAGFAQ